jgi:HEAT repeat protein
MLLRGLLMLGIAGALAGCEQVGNTVSSKPPLPLDVPWPVEVAAGESAGVPITKSQRIQAIQVVGAAHPNAVGSVPVVIEALKDEDAEVRRSAAEALARVDAKTPGVVPALAEALRDRDSEVRGAAALALGRLRVAREAVPPLCQTLRDSDARVRIQAAWALTRIDPEAKGAVSVLTAALKEADPQLRGLAAQALTGLGDRASEAVPTLAAALSDPTPGVRLWAAVALGEIGPPARAAVPALIRALEDSNHNVVMAVGSALDQIDPKAVTNSVLANGGDGELEKQASAARALMQRHAEVLRSVKDRATAEAARSKLDAIAAEYDQREKQMKRMPLTQVAVFLSQYHAGFEPLREELRREEARIKGLPEANAVLRSQLLFAEERQEREEKPVVAPPP